MTATITFTKTDYNETDMGPGPPGLFFEVGIERFLNAVAANACARSGLSPSFIASGVPE
ncbi:MAG TPA: hypothetical protein VMD53_18180 [Rhizomicrobium sp.]|nr:hypothetical protein [Rhizomicrobium sp.]